MIKNCNTCDRRYRPTNGRQRHCPKCGRRGGIKTCEVCTRRFKQKPNTSGRFCSVRCYGKHCKLKRTANCVTCGKSFVRPANNPQQKCCSNECADDLRRKPKPNCARCGKPCKKRGRTYCSSSCSGKVVRPRGGTAAIDTKSPAGNGYIRIKTEHGWKMEHREVMEQVLSRSLEDHERVHHRNGVRDDNRPDNLELWKVKDPPGVRAADYHCAGCNCF